MSLPPPPPLTGVLALSDINGNGFADVGVVQAGSVLVDVRDGLDDALITVINFGTDPGIAIEVIDDINGNGAEEIAVLGLRPSGQIRVQVRDSLTGASLNTICPDGRSLRGQKGYFG